MFRKNDWRFFPTVIKGHASRTAKARVFASPSGVCDRPWREGPRPRAGTGPPHFLPSTRQRRLTCVALSRARTSCSRKGSRPRLAVQKKRVPAAGSKGRSSVTAAMALEEGGGHVASGARGASPRLRKCRQGPEGQMSSKKTRERSREGQIGWEGRLWISLVNCVKLP